MGYGHCQYQDHKHSLNRKHLEGCWPRQAYRASVVAYEIALVSNFIGKGISIEILDQSHPLSKATSFTLSLFSPSISRPCMILLKVPAFDHLSCQKLKLLSFLRVHFASFLKVLMPFFIPFHTQEQGRLFWFLAFSL